MARIIIIDINKLMSLTGDVDIYFRCIHVFIDILEIHLQI